MKRVLIFVFLIVFIEILSAQTIEIDYPEEVGIGEEFEVELKLIDFEDSSYDVKIDLVQDGLRVSKILVDDKWESTFFYIKDSISDEESFSLKIFEECSGEIELSIRIRENGKSSSILFEGYEIEIDDNYESEEDDEAGEDGVEAGAEDESEDEEEDEDEGEGEDEGNEVGGEENGSGGGEDGSGSGNSNEKYSNETKKESKAIIIINESKDIKSNSSINFYKNVLAIDGLLSISVFLGIVYILKQGKYKNEFR